VLPEEQIISILNVRNFEKFTPFTITSPKQMLKKIEDIKRRGYAVSIQERYSYTAGVAAPCFLSRDLVGSIAVIGPAERIRANGIERTGKIVKKFAERLSSTLGYSKGPQRSDSSGKRLRMVK
jgi:IclR family transcriptional regulator, KDG regulon repressor